MARILAHRVKYVTKEVFERWTRRILPEKGDIILTREAPLGEVGMIQTDDQIFLGQRLMQYRANPKYLDDRYLLYAFQDQVLQTQIKLLGSGATVEHMRVPDAEKLMLWLPPLLEQNAIATALSDVDALITSLDKLIAKKRNIKQATMQQLLTGKTRLPGFSEELKPIYKQTEAGMIPVDWNVRTLGQLGEFKNGINKGKMDFGHGFPFVNLMDVFGGVRVSNDSGFGLVSSTDAERKMYSLKKGDILFVRSSVKSEGVGLTTLVVEDLRDTVYSGFLIRFRDKGELAFEFKEHYFGQFGFRNRLIAKSTLSANTNINQNALKNLQIAFPPSKAEQQAIATILTGMDAEISALVQKLDKTRALKQGMMQELLTGKTRLI